MARSMASLLPMYPLRIAEFPDRAWASARAFPHHLARVPLPRRRQRLVEVVDGEDDLPLRGGESAEVAQVGVPAALDADPGGRGASQVGRHREGRAPVERERGADHPPVSQREQVREASLLGLQDQFDRIPPIARGRPGGVRFPRAGRSQRLALGIPLGPCHELPLPAGGHWPLLVRGSASRGVTSRRIDLSARRYSKFSMRAESFFPGRQNLNTSPTTGPCDSTSHLNSVRLSPDE